MSKLVIKEVSNNHDSCNFCLSKTNIVEVRGTGRQLSLILCKECIDKLQLEVEMIDFEEYYVCNKTLKMIYPDNGKICFIKGKEYKRVLHGPLAFIDETNTEHTVAGHWDKHFTKIILSIVH